MAINTATIQHRRGSLEDFNPEKLMPGELAVITDERSVHMGFPGGGTERIILEKDFTSESIKEKLGYEPADEERVDQLFRDKADYQYVDKKVSNVKVDLTGYAKEDYVDDEIEELNKKIVQETGKLSNEIADKLSDLSNKANIIVNTKSGETIIATDSSDNKLRGLNVYGKSTQRTTEGNQLLRYPYSEGSVSKNGIDFTDNGDGSITMKGTNTSLNSAYYGIARNTNETRFTLKAGTYTISSNIKTESYYFSFVTLTPDGLEDNHALNHSKLSNTFTISEDRECFMFIVVDPGKSVDLTVKPMLNEGSTPLPWEPYTGGIPAPNPEHPQPIESVGDDGSVEVGVYKRNLFNPDVYGYMSDTTGEITSTSGNDIRAMSEYLLVSNVMTAIIKDYDSSNEYNYAYRVGWYDSEKNWLYNDVLKDTKTALKVPTKAKYFRTSEGYKDTLMICYGDVDEYEPSNKQTLAISTPNGLPGIPVTDASLATYTDENGQMWCADEIDYERSVLIQRVLRKLFSKGNVFLSTDGSYFFVVAKEAIPNKNFFYCNIAKHKCNNMDYANVWSAGDGRIIIGNLDANGNSVHSTVDELFSNIDMFEILVILAEPIETPLSAEELDQYKALTMNYPTTTILNDAYAYMEVKYSADTQNHIEQNYVPKSAYTALEARVATLEKNAL